MAKEKLIAVAAELWDKFERGKGKESQNPFSDYVAEMWRTAGFPSDFFDNGKALPWAGAFISHVLNLAEYPTESPTFPSSHLLHHAIGAAKENPASVDFHPAPALHIPPEPGDLIFSSRGDKPVDFEVAQKESEFRSHTDLVVAKGMTQVWAVGGNLANSVSLVRFPLLENGFLDPYSSRVFAVMKNRR